MGRFHINKSELQTTIQIAWPAILESFFVALASLIDTLMVSRLGANAVAAVGLVTQPRFVGLCIFIAINTSVSALVARRKGEGNRTDANRILSTAFLIVSFFAVIICSCCIIFASPLMELCGSNPDIHEDSKIYFQIVMGGSFPHIFNLLVNSVFRGFGNTKLAMRTNIISNVTNIIGNYLLITGELCFPALGVRGAAIATVLGTVVGFFVSLISLFNEKNYVNFFYIIRNKLFPSISCLISIIRIAINLMVEQLLMRIGFLSVSIMVAKLGTAALSAHQIGMNIMQLSFSFGDGMQAAAITLIGQSLGMKDIPKATRYGKMCQSTGTIIACTLALLYFFSGRTLYTFFFQEEEIIQLGIKIMYAMIPIVLFQIRQVIYGGILRGGGDVIFTTISSAISVTFVRPIVSYLMAFALHMGLIGIWLGILGDQFLRFLFTSLRFRSGAWTTHKI